MEDFKWNSLKLPHVETFQSIKQTCKLYAFKEIYCLIVNVFCQYLKTVPKCYSSVQSIYHVSSPCPIELIVAFNFVCKYGTWKLRSH